MMKSKSLMAIVATAVVAAAAWYYSELKAPEREVGSTPLFPDLTERVNDVKRVKIESRTHKAILVADANTWKIENRDGYPARFEDVKRGILSLGELRIIEQKTKLPEMYPHIGVEDVKAENSASTQVTLEDGAGKPLASLIIGKLRAGAGGPIKAARYVRRSGEAQSYLVQGDLNMSADPLSWTDRQLLSIPASRIREVKIEHPGKPAVDIRRDKPADTDLKLQDIPQGFKAKATATVTSLASALEELRFDDVRAAASVKWPAEATTTTLRGFDGLVATAKTASIDNHHYTQFEFAFDPAGVTAGADATKDAKQPQVTEIPLPGAENSKPAAKQENETSVADEVKSLNERVRGWLFVLPDYKHSMLTRTMDDLIAKQEQTKPAKPAPPPPPPDPLTVERFDEHGRLIPPEETGESSAPIAPEATSPAPDAQAPKDPGGSAQTQSSAP